MEIGKNPADRGSGGGPSAGAGFWPDNLPHYLYAPLGHSHIEEGEH